VSLHCPQQQQRLPCVTVHTFPGALATLTESCLQM
jgi:hypothetical protein